MKSIRLDTSTASSTQVRVQAEVSTTLQLSNAKTKHQVPYDKEVFMQGIVSRPQKAFVVKDINMYISTVGWQACFPAEKTQISLLR